MELNIQKFKAFCLNSLKKNCSSLPIGKVVPYVGRMPADQHYYHMNMFRSISQFSYQIKSKSDVRVIFFTEIQSENLF